MNVEAAVLMVLCAVINSMLCVSFSGYCIHSTYNVSVWQKKRGKLSCSSATHDKTKVDMGWRFQLVKYYCVNNKCPRRNQLWKGWTAKKLPILGILHILTLILFYVETFVCDWGISGQWYKNTHHIIRTPMWFTTASIVKVSTALSSNLNRQMVCYTYPSRKLSLETVWNRAGTWQVTGWTICLSPSIMG